jgi:TusA-related sulfurtransferase
VVDVRARLGHLMSMAMTKLDLTGLKCPLPALKTRKALKGLVPGDRLEVHCTDPETMSRSARAPTPMSFS